MERREKENGKGKGRETYPLSRLSSFFSLALPPPAAALALSLIQSMMLSVVSVAWLEREY